MSISEGRYLAPFMEEIVLSDTTVKLDDKRKGVTADLVGENGGGTVTGNQG